MWTDSSIDRSALNCCQHQRHFEHMKKLVYAGLILAALTAHAQFIEHEERDKRYLIPRSPDTQTPHKVGPSAESTFFTELIKDPDVDKNYLGRAINRRCTACQAPMVERNSQHGLFFGCSNYPICEATSRPCIACGRGFLVRYGVQICCDNPRCNKEYEACPECEDGLLVERMNRKTGQPFLGCTNYSSGTCTYTRNIQGLNVSGHRRPLKF